MNNTNEFKSLNDVSAIIKGMARKINSNKSDLPTFGQSTDFGKPYVEITEDGYSYVIVERGKEIKRKTSKEICEFLYIVFENVTSSIARRYELNNRNYEIDSRRVIFSKQEELLNRLNPDWCLKLKSQHNIILRDHPFDDYAYNRAILCKRFREEGNSDQQAWVLACAIYPLPKVGGEAPFG